MPEIIYNDKFKKFNLLTDLCIDLIVFYIFEHSINLNIFSKIPL